MDHILAEGLQFPEGPVALPGGEVLVAEIAAGRVSRVGHDGAVSLVAETGGGPNGLAFGPDGRLYCCNNGGLGFLRGPAGRLVPHDTPDSWRHGAIQAIDLASGRVETLYTHAGDTPLRGPNDLVFDAQGGFWFTDHGKSFGRSRDRTGVFYARADGSLIREAIFPLENPNGIGLSPDGATLYVAETFTCMLWAFDLAAPGEVVPASRRLLCRPEGAKWFDSLGVEADGAVCVATIGAPGVTVVDPAGGQREFIPTDDTYTTNICWGGDDLRTAFITLSGTGRLLQRPWPRPGLRLAFGPPAPA